ncbi:MAG: amidohydrolase family protein, partial [Thermodesulfobacteriota bacterium]
MAGLLIHNARIITMDPQCPRASALAIKEGRIQALGDSGSLLKPIDRKTEVLDLRGRTVLPGFFDAHVHFRAMAESQVTLNISPEKGVTQISRLQEWIYQETLRHPLGTWIRAGGYDDTALAEKRDPRRWDLDPVSPHHPLKLTHRSGQAHVLNSLALKQLNINRETPDPEGGLMERDLESGEPTGVFYGAGDFLAQQIPPLEEPLLNVGLQSADKELLRYGITAFQDASPRNDGERWQAFKKWKAKGWIRGSVVMMLGIRGFQELIQNPSFFSAAGPDLKTGGVKIKVDEFSGRLFPGEQELEALVFSIHRAGLQAVIHAIEEPAIEAACLTIEKALKKIPRSDHRHRIEHCSVCPPSLAERIASLGIMVVSHPAFVYFNGDRYLKTVPPPELRCLYPFKTLWRKGVS